MYHLKKAVWGFLAVLLSLSFVLSGCGASSNSAATPAPTKNVKKSAPYQIVFAYLTFTPQKDLSSVQAAVSKITMQKINATVKLMPLSVAQYNQKLHLMFIGGQQLDVLVSSTNGGFSSLVDQGFLAPMDTLLAQDGQGITKAFADYGLSSFLKVGMVNGKRYAIPTIKQFASADGFGLNKDLLDKYNIDASQIKTASDMTPVLKLIKQKDPTITPLQLGSNPPPPGYFPQSHFDNLGDTIGVLMLNGANSSSNQLKVVDLFETPFYANALKTVRGWWNDGLINPDAATTNENASNVIEAGKAFAMVQPGIDPAFAFRELGQAVPVKMVMTSKAVADTGTVADVMLSIAKNSKNPAMAMKFINLMYTDPQLANLLDWGIEGKDYVKKSDTSIAYPPGVNSNTVPYTAGIGEAANDFIMYTFAPSQPADLWKQMDAWNKDAVRSPALGFLFDANSVKTQYAAVSNVISQYQRELQTGSVDPAKVLPKFISQLKAAGIDQIIAAKQKQLDAWEKAQQ